MDHEEIRTHTCSEHHFRLQTQKHDNKVDTLFKCLMQMQDLKKKQLIFASSEALGRILVIQPDLVPEALPLLL